jgi:Arc/MetJ-type ribon-helix-helix transcriptional regulator
MKISVSLPDDDVSYLDGYARARGYASRSAVLQQAVQLLRTSELSAQYEQAWDEWAASGEAELWDLTTADGLS